MRQHGSKKGEGKTHFRINILYLVINVFRGRYLSTFDNTPSRRNISRTHWISVICWLFEVVATRIDADLLPRNQVERNSQEQINITAAMQPGKQERVLMIFINSAPAASFELDAASGFAGAIEAQQIVLGNGRAASWMASCVGSPPTPPHCHDEATRARLEALLLPVRAALVLNRAQHRRHPSTGVSL